MLIFRLFFVFEELVLIGPQYFDIFAIEFGATLVFFGYQAVGLVVFDESINFDD